MQRTRTCWNIESHLAERLPPRSLPTALGFSASDEPVLSLINSPFSSLRMELFGSNHTERPHLCFSNTSPSRAQCHKSFHVFKKPFFFALSLDRRECFSPFGQWLAIRGLFVLRGRPLLLQSVGLLSHSMQVKQHLYELLFSQQAWTTAPLTSASGPQGVFFFFSRKHNGSFLP